MIVARCMHRERHSNRESVRDIQRERRAAEPAGSDSAGIARGKVATSHFHRRRQRTTRVAVEGLPRVARLRDHHRAGRIAGRAAIPGRASRPGGTRSDASRQGWFSDLPRTARHRQHADPRLHDAQRRHRPRARSRTRRHDYVVKPIEPRVLLGRIEALWRRSEREGKSARLQQVLKIGPFVITRSARSATYRGTAIDLTSVYLDGCFFKDDGRSGAADVIIPLEDPPRRDRDRPRRSPAPMTDRNGRG